MRGRFITLEGGEGAGKSTQARMLADVLSGRGLTVVVTREPGGAPGSEYLRELLLSGRFDWDPRAEMMLHVAARVEHVAKTIRPAIEAGSWVISDRFHDSTMAYQGYGLGVDRGMIAALAGMLGITPDLTIVLDVPRDVGLARLRLRGGDADRYERLNDLFHERVNNGFRDIARLPGRLRIDAGGEPDVVHRAILDAVDRMS